MSFFDDLNYAAELADLAEAPAIWPSHRIGPGVRSYRPSDGCFARINRHTGKPHEHRRECARRVRQAGGAA